MTGKRIWLMVLTAFVISVVIVFGSAAAAITHPNSEIKETTEASEVQTEISFILRIWNGKLGLFRGDSETPYREIEMPLYLLTEHDRKLLEDGISAESEEELRALIEDITS